MESNEMNRSSGGSRCGVRGISLLIGIFGIFVIGVFLAWLVARDNPEMSSRGAESSLYTSGRHAGVNAVSSRYAVRHPQMLEVFEFVEVPDAGADCVAPEQTGARSSSGADGGGVSEGTSAYNDRIEREAREVLHGDFGNNPERKAALGGDYAAVQKRVNEILHARG